MQGPEKNSYNEFDNEKKFLRLESSPPPPLTFLMVRPLLIIKNSQQARNDNLSGMTDSLTWNVLQWWHMQSWDPEETI